MEPDHRQVAEFYDVHYHGKATAGSPGRALRRLSRRLGIAPGEEILDIACGTGEWLTALAERGACVSGIDISERAVSVCRDVLPDARIEVGAAESLPYESDRFDLVTCMGSLEHFLDQPRALGEMVRVTRSGGRIILLVPNAGFLPYRLGLYRGTQQQAIRETIRPVAEWRSMFEEAGLEIEALWRDLHILDRRWILRSPWRAVPLRALLAVQLPFWPLSWQYQVHFICRAPR